MLILCLRSTNVQQIKITKNQLTHNEPGAFGGLDSRVSYALFPCGFPTLAISLGELMWIRYQKILFVNVLDVFWGFNYSTCMYILDGYYFCYFLFVYWCFLYCIYRPKTAFMVASWPELSKQRNKVYGGTNRGSKTWCNTLTTKLRNTFVHLGPHKRPSTDPNTYHKSVWA